MLILPAPQIATTIAKLSGAVSLDLPNPLVFANFSAHCDAAQRRSLLSRNLPRQIELPAIRLLRYPPGTLVYGDRSYLTVAGEAIVAEQVAPWCKDPVTEASEMRSAPERAIGISQECVLLARFGENTWGHWVGEMLVKAAIAERFFPGRFFYAVPWWTTERTERRGYADAVLESLAAFGILPDRLVRMGAFQFYSFANLHDIAGAWQKGPHPAALDILRAVSTPKGRARKRERIALLRRPPDARAIANADELEIALEAQGFSVVDFAAQSFTAQIRLFRDADLVVGSLGSHFAASLFAGVGKRLISLAPANWADGYFIDMFQHLDARHADLRGPSVLQDGVPTERAPHAIRSETLAAAIEAMLQPEAAGAPSVDGEAMPRRLGAPLLELAFRAGQAVPAALTGAWSDPEPTHRWSLGPSCGVSIPPGTLPAKTALWLEIAGQGHVYPPAMPTRPLQVLARGREVGRFDLIGRGRYFCRLAAGRFESESGVCLTFLHPVCPSPRSMGAGADDRPLGFGFERLAFHADAG